MVIAAARSLSSGRCRGTGAPAKEGAFGRRRRCKIQTCRKCSVSGTAVDVCPMSDSPRCEKSEGGMTAAANVAPPRMPRSAERYMRSEAESGRRRIAVAAAVSGRRSCRRARCASGTRRAPAWVQLHQLGWHSTAWARTASSVDRSNVGVSCQLRRAGAVHADHEHPSHTQAHTHTHLQLDWRRVDAGG